MVVFVNNNFIIVVIIDIVVIIIFVVVRTTVNRRNQVEIEVKNNYFCILEVEHPESSSSSSGLWKRNFEI